MVVFSSNSSPEVTIKLAKFPFLSVPILFCFNNKAGCSVMAARAFSFGKPKATAFLKLGKKSLGDFKSLLVRIKGISFSAKSLRLNGA